MSINGDDARIQIQKLADVDQMDKAQQEIQRGEAGAIRKLAEEERRKKLQVPNELKEADKALIRERPHRKGKDPGEDNEEMQAEAEKSRIPEDDDDEGKPKHILGKNLDLCG